MGAGPAKLNIDLTEKENFEDITNLYRIDRSKTTYQNDYEKVTYSITYHKKGFSSSNLDYFYLYIRDARGRNPLFTYYVKEEKHIVRSVESYFSKHHQDTPLIIGFKRYDPVYFQYYTYIYLKGQKSSYGFPSSGGFLENQLYSKLIEEYNLVLQKKEEAKHLKNIRTGDTVFRSRFAAHPAKGVLGKDLFSDITRDDNVKASPTIRGIGVRSHLYIDLNEKDGFEDIKGWYKVERSNIPYGDNNEFRKVTYSISYYQRFYKSNIDYYYLYIRDSGGKIPIFTYYVTEHYHIVRSVETYYSKDNLNVTLVIGFVRNDGRKYYTYLFLKEEKSSTGFPISNYFLFDQVYERLKQEYESIFKAVEKTTNLESSHTTDIRSRTRFSGHPTRGIFGDDLFSDITGTDDERVVTQLPAQPSNLGPSIRTAATIPHFPEGDGVMRPSETSVVRGPTTTSKTETPRRNVSTSFDFGSQSKLYINLNNKSVTEHTPGKYKIEHSKTTYQNDYEKVTYSITYHQGGYSWSNRAYFYIYLRKNEGGDVFFTYYVSDKKHIVRNIEAYFSIYHPQTPLVIGFKRDDPPDYQYYTYLDLKKTRSYNGLPKNGLFKSENLLKNLKEGVHGLESKMTFIIGSSIDENVDIIQQSIHSRNEFLKYSYVTNRSNGPPWRVYSSNLFKKSPSTKIDDSIFNEINGLGFDGISVFYTKDHNPLAVEFSNGYNNKSNFVRKDIEGKIWSNETIYGEIDASKLSEIKLNYESNITFQLNKGFEYTKGIIKVSNEPQSSDGYTVYKHLATNFSNLKKTSVLYNGRDIVIIPNSNITNFSDKLKSLEGEVFKEIDTYSLDSNSSEHLLMKLTTISVKKYFLYRFGKDGTKWRQLDHHYLVNLNILSRDQLVESFQRTQGQGLGKWMERYINDSKSENIKKLLWDINANINSIIVLLDHKTQYNNSHVTSILGPDKEISPLDVNSNIVIVEDVSTRNGPCLKIGDYKLYKHDLTKAGIKGLEKVGNKDLYIRFYSGKNMIILYENDNSEGPRSYVKYFKEYSELFVYFCNNATTLLLLYYNSNSYKPQAKGSNIWVKVPEIRDCRSSSNIKTHLDKIKKELCPEKTEVIGSTRGDSHVVQGGRNLFSEGSTRAQTPEIGLISYNEDLGTPSVHDQGQFSALAQAQSGYGKGNDSTDWGAIGGGTGAVVGVGAVSGGVVLVKFPYIFFPSMKALL